MYIHCETDTWRTESKAQDANYSWSSSHCQDLQTTQRQGKQTHAARHGQTQKTYTSTPDWKDWNRKGETYGQKRGEAWSHWPGRTDEKHTRWPKQTHHQEKETPVTIAATMWSPASSEYTKICHMFDLMWTMSLYDCSCGVCGSPHCIKHVIDVWNLLQQINRTRILIVFCVLSLYYVCMYVSLMLGYIYCHLKNWTWLRYAIYTNFFGCNWVYFDLFQITCYQLAEDGTIAPKHVRTLIK